MPERSRAGGAWTRYALSVASGALGVKTAAVLPRMRSTRPSTAAEAALVSRSVGGPRKSVASMGSENFSRTTVSMVTPLAPGAGVRPITDGGVTSSVVKVDANSPAMTCSAGKARSRRPVTRTS